MGANKAQTEEVNREGLTWREWLTATGAGISVWSSQRHVMRKAWRDGEDPSEWRAHFKG